MIKKNILKVYSYLGLFLVSGFFFVKSGISYVDTNKYENIISDYKTIEHKLDNLYYLYEQPVKIKNLVNENYFDSLKTLENKLIASMDSIKSLPYYETELKKYNDELKKYEFKNRVEGVKFFVSMFASALSFGAFMVALSYKNNKTEDVSK